MASALVTFIENHGFTAFVNLGGESVSFWVPDTAGDRTLMTVDSVLEARIALGY